MSCIALVRYVLVLRCGLAGMVWCGIWTQAEALHYFKKQVTSSWSLSLSNYQDDARPNKHKVFFFCSMSYPGL